MSIVQSGVQAISVLIDTWWNVNADGLIYLPDLIRF